MSLALKQGFGRLIRRADDRGVVAILDERLSRKTYGRDVRRDLPPARFTRHFAEVHRFFREALESTADFALNVWAWAEDVDAPIDWQWQLVRLQDGKADAAQGAAALPSQVAAEIHAAIAGLENLRDRIERAGRSPSDFQVELRCSPEARAILEAAGKRGFASREQRAAWRAAREAWGGVRIVAVGAEA
jgi:ATP-dependent DNA helicase DinG